MEIKSVQKNEFNDLIKEGYVLVDFYATWCGPCKMLSPVLEKVKDLVQVVKVDIDEHEDLPTKYSVMSVPTLILFKDGKLVDRKLGFLPEQVLTQWIEKNK